MNLKQTIKEVIEVALEIKKATSKDSRKGKNVNFWEGLSILQELADLDEAIENLENIQKEYNALTSVERAKIIEEITRELELKSTKSDVAVIETLIILTASARLIKIL